MAEEVKESPQEEKVEETVTSSEKVENSEAIQSQEKPEVQEVAKEPEAKEETPVDEEKVEEPKTSVLDELLSRAGEVKTEEEPKPQSAVGDVEKEIARAVYPKLDPGSKDYDRGFEENVMKEYIYRWAMAGGSKGPTLREVASQITASDTSKPEVSDKKAEAIAKPSTIPGPEAERTITADEERRLMEGVKSGNQAATVELLRLRRQQKSE